MELQLTPASTTSASAPAPVVPAAGARIHYLDSVRGLAAFSVLIYHYIGWRWGEQLPTKLAFMIFNGSDAVSLFFVLSGLVLSWRFMQHAPDQEPPPITWFTYRQYVINRVIRLYLPFLVLLPVYYFYVHRHDAAQVLLDDLLSNRYSWIEEGLLIRGVHAHYGPAWTLEVEVAGSLLLPFLVMILRRDQRLFLAFMAVVLVLGPKLLFWGIFHFGMGMWLAYNYRAIATYNPRGAWWWPLRWVGYGLIFLLFGVRHLDRIHPFGATFGHLMGLLQLDLFHLTGIAAALFLAIAINRPGLQRVLESRPFLFLGTVSYGVYLLHWFFVVGTMDHWDQYARWLGGEQRAYWILLAFNIVATLLAGYVFHRLIEVPSIRLGKRVAAAFGRPSA